MNSYYFVHRIKWPAMLVVVGITALLDEYNIISYSHSWPLYLIVLGLLTLAERAMLAQLPPANYPYQQPWSGAPAPGYAPSGYPPAGYSGQPPQPPSTPVSTSIVPVPDVPLNDRERS
jgi:hypothetical protein